MTNQHPITPPPELVDYWARAALGAKDWLGGYDLEMIANAAAHWGADQQLELDATWVALQTSNRMSADRLRFEMRPAPPSLKEQALAELDLLKGDAKAHGLGFDAPAIRRALDALPD